MKRCCYFTLYQFIGFIMEHSKMKTDNEKETNRNNEDTRKKSQIVPTMKEKQFTARNSILTDLFEIAHFRTILNIFITILLLILCLNIIPEEYFATGSNTRVAVILWNLGNFGKALRIWITMFTTTLFIVYYGFHLWACSGNVNQKAWNRYWLSLYIMYICSFLYYPTKYVLLYDLPPLSSMIVLVEQIRMLMKTHSFVRHNAEKVLYPHSDSTKQNSCPKFSKYFYFFFVPTLIYRDEYPRTRNINLYFVITNFCQVIGCILYMNIVVTDYFHAFYDIGCATSSPQKVFQSIVSSMLPSTILLLCAFFLILHSWTNAFAEICRFADRQFYTDWWNSYSYPMYYRTWNIVVHDWLYTYILRDLSRVMPSYKKLCVYCVFFVSSIFHDYIMSFVLRFYLPNFLIMFGGFGAAFFFMPYKGNRRSWSIFFWTTMIMGVGIMASLYSIEWYSRKNCAPYSDKLVDYFIPRMISCYEQMNMFKTSQL